MTSRTAGWPTCLRGYLKVPPTPQNAEPPSWVLQKLIAEIDHMSTGEVIDDNPEGGDTLHSRSPWTGPPGSRSHRAKVQRLRDDTDADEEEGHSEGEGQISRDEFLAWYTAVQWLARLLHAAADCILHCIFNRKCNRLSTVYPGAIQLPLEGSAILPLIQS